MCAAFFFFPRQPVLYFIPVPQVTVLWNFAYLYAPAILVLHFDSIAPLKAALQTGIQTRDDQRQYFY